VEGDYRENYAAVSREGWQFAAWGNYCARNSVGDTCNFELPGEVVQDAGMDEVPPLVAYFRRQFVSGHRALLMGHSFFNPFSVALPGDAVRAGFDDHDQAAFMSGGSGGAPLSFWNNEAQSDAIKMALDEGGFTLLGMTYYPLQENGVSIDDNLQGYSNWIDHALRENSDFSVFIGMPWGRNADSLTYWEFLEEWIPGHEEVHGFIDSLRQEFPELDIYCVPYGLAVMELNKRFEAGRIPDLVGEVGDAGNHMFTDSLGHPGSMVEDLVRLVWLRAIYAVDLESYDHNYNYETDLVALANLVMNRHNHHYDAR
jgi:hypothetical protein